MNLHVCERNKIFHNLYLVVNSELSVVSALAHTVTEICTTSFINFVITDLYAKNSNIFNLHVCERNNIFLNLYLVVNSELSVVSL